MAAANAPVSIARLAATDRRAFDARFRSRQPVLFRDALERWSADLRSFEGLALRFGAIPVWSYRLEDARRGRRMSSVNRDFYRWSDGDGSRRHLRRWSFAQFLAALLRGEPHYCMANGTKNRQLRDALAAQTGNLRNAMHGGRCDPGACEFFIGSEGAGPGLHHDGVIESLLCQLIGTKRVHAFSPTDVAHLYPTDSWLAQRSHFSAISNSFAVDGKRFPLFQRATPYRCRLKPGDVLYMPPYWYHDPSPEGPNVMMTCRFTPPSKYWGTPKQRDKLARTATALQVELGKLAPPAQATFAALLARDFQVRHRKV